MVIVNTFIHLVIFRIIRLPKPWFNMSEYIYTFIYTHTHGSKSHVTFLDNHWFHADCKLAIIRPCRKSCKEMQNHISFTPSTGGVVMGGGVTAKWQRLGLPANQHSICTRLWLESACNKIGLYILELAKSQVDAVVSVDYSWTSCY